jgi:hypothetical protein
LCSFRVLFLLHDVSAECLALGVPFQGEALEQAVLKVLADSWQWSALNSP